MAMLVLITLITLIGAYLVASRLTRTSAELSADRDQRTMQSLQEAKAALIAWAANPSLTQVGSLPCPDRKLASDTAAGQEESSCDTDAVRIGRLPWKTLNVSSDLRDGSGEQLWYVLSANFRKKAYPGSGYTTINSDTQGQITVTGSAPATNVVALIIAPGIALTGQNRDKTNLTEVNNASNYLEGSNGGTNDNAFETRASPNDKDSSGGLIFNDRIITITQADLMAAVEPVVVNKIRDSSIVNVKPAIEAYRTTWGRYPFPAAFTNPGTSDYKGTVGATEGLLPLTTDSTFITWKTSSPTPTLAKVGTTGTVANISCAASTTTQLDCQFDYSGAPTIRVSATANNAGLAFVRAFAISDLTVVRTATPSANLCAPLCNWSGVTTTSVSATVSTSSTYTLANDGTGAIALVLVMPSRSTTRTIRVRVPVPPYHSLTTITDPNTGWFIANQWYKDAYFAVAPAYLPGGTTPCTAGTDCLTVSGLPSNEYATANDKYAILIMAGQSLNGTSRPSATLANYLEGQNATTGDRTFANRVGAPGDINDRVVVLAP